MEVEAQASLAHTIKEVGVDRNVSDGRWVVLSGGTKHSGPDLALKVARRRRYQRRLARQVKGSNRRKIAKVRLQKAFAGERFARLNWAHHVSKNIAGPYDLAYIEALNIKGMTKSAKGTKEKPGKNVKQKSGLNRQILASGWGCWTWRWRHRQGILPQSACEASTNEQGPSCGFCYIISSRIVKNRRLQNSRRP